MYKQAIIAGAICAMLAVVLGAFGAHALKDKLSANICGDLITTNYDYNRLGARILISNLLKNLKANW